MSQLGIENRLYWVRDVTYQEDKSLVRTGNASRVMATLRSLAISLLRLDGQGIGVGVANLCRAGFGIDGDDLIAGGKNRHARSDEDFQSRLADGGCECDCSFVIPLATAAGASTNPIRQPVMAWALTQSRPDRTVPYFSSCHLTKRGQGFTLANRPCPIDVSHVLRFGDAMRGGNYVHQSSPGR